MQAGKLRNYVTLQLNTPTVDGYGEPVAAWADVGTYPASVRPTSGRGEVTHRITLRALATRPDPLAYRVAFEGRILDLLSVEDPTGRGAELLLLCREQVEA
jgi:head-tail adaptor